jgi:RHS repeat-associated protein
MHVGNLNPFRYRGYYFDVETNLYYLKARYYDAEVCRFISQDGIEYLDPETINGLNLYSYCGNNPVMNVDKNGNAFITFLVAAIIGGVVAACVSAISQVVVKGKVDLGIVAIDGLFGALSAMLWMVPGLGPVATGLLNAGLTLINSTITTGIENDWTFSTADIVSIAFATALSGIVSGAMRSQFFRVGGQRELKESHKFIDVAVKRLNDGSYIKRANPGKSINSAKGAVKKHLAKMNFGSGFFKDTLIDLLQELSADFFVKGLERVL